MDTTYSASFGDRGRLVVPAGLRASQEWEQGTALWQHGGELSLGDRPCLALARRLDVAVLTADQAWRESETVVQVR